MSDVIVVGAGPVGLWLASELRLAGVAVEVLEKLPAATGLSKALGITGRGEDYLAMRGLLERFRKRAPPPPPANLLHFALISLDLKRTSLAPKGIFVPQAITEEILGERAGELGVTVRRGVTVSALKEDAAGVSVEVSEGATSATHRARYVVGCDGSRSVVRAAAGIRFEGTEPTSVMRLGDVKLADGVAVPRMLIPLGDGWFRLITKEPLADDFDPAAPMTLAELRESAARVHRLDVPLREARWLSRFTDASRQADAYRRGRLLIAGDAAHIHLPAGGPGLLTGFGDALNLGWKLGAVVRGQAPEDILDTYDAERRPVGARVLEHTRAQGRLTSPDSGSVALRSLVTELTRLPAVVEHFARMLWQTDTRYVAEHDATHPLVGFFVPETARVVTKDGAKSILALLQAGRWLALETAPTFGARLERLGALHVTAAALEGMPPVSALLVRPDGHVAWAGERADAALDATIDAWTARGAAATRRG
jgi:2-polyprenyl-6-methoxyphenol hydroxylase-like FAD-dependent oxidoreductase